MPARQRDTAVPAGPASAAARRARVPAAEPGSALGDLLRGAAVLRAGGRGVAAQAAALRQATGGRLARAGPLLLQLQRQRGNRYVQRLAAQPGTPMSAREDGGLAEPGRGPGRDLPPHVRAGVETLSGVSLGPVGVHYDSAEPAGLDAAAFAGRGEIHLAPGQERYLAHEAWHLIQQAQGRVRPAAGGTSPWHISEDAGLEREADAMGARALSRQEPPGPHTARTVQSSATPASSPAASFPPVVQLGGGNRPQPGSRKDRKNKQGPQARAKSKAAEYGEGEYVGGKGNSTHVHVFHEQVRGHLKVAGKVYNFNDWQAVGNQDSLSEGVDALHQKAMNTNKEALRASYRAIRERFPDWFVGKTEPDWY